MGDLVADQDPRVEFVLRLLGRESRLLGDPTAMGSRSLLLPGEGESPRGSRIEADPLPKVEALLCVRNV